ncbi:MAG: CHASE2 domain-containing protein, partial [Kiloniellales bacterium]|nr:CHASE2 domain-containing protein [Kiloniellales bacterium]
KTEWTGDVVVVDIDDQSLLRYGQWPWPRNLMARLSETIFSKEPSVLGFDVTFAERDRQDPLTFLENYPELPQAVQRTLGDLPRNDEVFAEVLAEGRVVAGIIVGFGPAASSESLPAGPPLFLVGEGSPRLPTYAMELRNIAQVNAAVTSHGVINLSFESDGVLRRIPSIMRVGDGYRVTLGLELLRLAKESVLLLHSDRAGVLGVELAGRWIKTDRFGRLWPRFSMRRDLPRVSAGDLLDGTAKVELSDRIVIVGSSAAGLGSHVLTPNGGPLPSLEIHATLLDGLIAGDLLSRPRGASLLEMVIFFVSGLLLIAASTLRRPLLLIGTFFGLLSIFSLGAMFLFLFFSLLLDAAYPVMALILLFLTVATTNLVIAERRRREEARLAELRERDWLRHLRALQSELIVSSRQNTASYLSGALAHELNQPMAALYNYLQAAQRSLSRGDQKDVEKLSRYLGKAIDQAKRSSAILRDMRGVVERGDLSARPDDLVSVIREGLALAREAELLEGIDLRLELPRDLPKVSLSRVQTHQVLLNLIQNAVDAMIESEKKCLQLSARASEDGQVAVTLHDSGPGVPEDLRSNLMRPFFTTKAKGTGLGLPIC